MSRGYEDFHAGEMKVGDPWTAIKQIHRFKQTLTPSAVGANTSTKETFTVTGLKAGDFIVVDPPANTTAAKLVNARVSADDTLELEFVNPTAGQLTPDSGEFAILFFRPTNP